MIRCNILLDTIKNDCVVLLKTWTSSFCHRSVMQMQDVQIKQVYCIVTNFEIEFDYCLFEYAVIEVGIVEHNCPVHAVVFNVILGE